MTKKKSIIQRTLKRITDLTNEVVQTLTAQFFTSHYLSQNYIITLGIISLLALGGHLFIHHALYQQSRDNYVTKVARQQLILSETLSKTALVIQATNDYKKNVEYTSLFRNKLNLWRNFHEGLQKRHEKLGLSGQNSVQVINMFADLQPIYWKMDTFATKLVNTLEEDLFHSAFYADFAIDVSQLIEIEAAFMQQMEAIVRQYETEAASHVNYLKRINFVWVTLTLIVLLLQGLYVFHPTFQVVEELKQKLTDFKKTTEEKDAWLQGMLDNIPALIYLKDYQGRYKFTNRQFETLSHTKPESMKGKNDYDFFEPQLAAILQANDFKVLESKTPFQLEETILQEDGLHTYHSIRFPLINTTKGAYAVVGIYLDMTECRKLKNALQKNQAMLQALLGAIPEIALFIDAQGLIIHANHTAVRKLGLPKEGGHIDHFFPTVLLDKRQLYLHEVFRTGLPIRFEDVTHGRYLDNFVYPTVLAQETVNAAMVCVDITKTRSSTHLKETIERISPPSYFIDSWLWEKVINSLYEGIIIADATQSDLPVIYVNPAFEHLTGYQASEIIGKNCRFLHSGDAHQSALTEVRNALQHGKNCNVVLRNYRKDGTSFWNRLCISPLYDEYGKLTHFVGIQINITTQKQAEEALRISEERYRRIVNTTQEGIWVTDEHAVISFANQRLADMLEDSLDEMINHSLFEFMDETTTITIKPLFEQTVPWNKGPKDICFHRRKGSRLWTLVNMSQLFDENHKLIGILGMVADITERKQAEEALLASENKFRSLTESVAAIILICQEDEIIYANSSTTLLTGYSQSELIHKKLNELIHPDDIIKQTSPFEENSLPHHEVSLLTKQQEIRWLEVTIRPIEFQGISSTLITAFDITERKQTQETLRNVVEGVSSTTGENFLKSLMEYLAQCLQVKYALVGQLLPSKHTKISTLAVICNHQLIDNFEYELENTPCEELLKGKRATCCSCSQGLKDLFPSNRLLVEEQIESCVGTPLLDAKGTLLGVMIIMDIKPLNHLKLVESMLQIFAARASGELQRIQMLEALQKERASLAERILERTAELTNANAELARAARLKNEFIANMSHELRTPLNTIITLSEALQDEQIYGELNQPQNNSIHAIEDSGRHLLGLINDILELAKIEAGKVKLQVLPVSVEGISKACMRTMKAWTEKKHIKMTLTIDQLVTNIQADDRYLTQILTNLLSNAVKFTPEEGQVNLDIKGSKDQSVVYLSVSDTGKGIAQEDMLHLFKPFEQLDGRLAKEYEGTGLGLCLIYRLTEMHGGSVIVESGMGQGSRFTICLPWQSEEFPLSPLHHQEAVVLLAEDNPSILARLFDYLSLNGYQVVVARNGIQVVEQAIEFKPDIILMDLQMPVMDGLKAIRQIRAHPDVETIPIIALTALIVPGEKDRCLEAGANEYLSKPVSFKELNRALTTILKQVSFSPKSP